MNNLPRLIKLLWTYPGRTLGGLVAIIISNCVQLSIPYITKYVIDNLELGQVTRRELLSWGALVLLLAGISYIAKQIWRHLILGAARRVEAQLRQSLLDKTLSLTMRAAQKTDNGKFMALASNDIPAVGQALAFGVIAFFDSIFITVVAFTLMYRLSPTLTLYSVLPFPCLAMVMLGSLKLIYKRWDRVQQALEDLTEKSRESLSGLRTLRAYAQQEGDVEDFQRLNQEHRNRVLHYMQIDAVFRPLILLFAGSSSGILLYFGGGMVIEGSVSVGTLAAFVGYLGLLTWPMIAAGWMLILLQRGSASIARLDKILQIESEQSDLPSLPAQSRIEVRDLTFSFEDGTTALKQWNFSLQPGQTLGIVGPVGSGKSTLLKLLQRLEDPPAGSILLNGKDITQYSPESIRSSFAYVSQEPMLFSDTIANNLLMARPQSTPDELKQVVALASLEDDLERFPDRLDTMLGERGVTLSGGQKQRTALARTLLKEAPILLLDDTLSAVDTVTEKSILSHLKERQETSGQSVIIVSHRLSAVAQADEILVVDHGRIVDRGDHRTLSTKPGLYRDLLKLQEGGDDLLA